MSIITIVKINIPAGYVVLIKKKKKTQHPLLFYELAFSPACLFCLIILNRFHIQNAGSKKIRMFCVKLRSEELRLATGT